MLLENRSPSNAEGNINVNSNDTNPVSTKPEFLESSGFNTYDLDFQDVKHPVEILDCVNPNISIIDINVDELWTFDDKLIEPITLTPANDDGPVVKLSNSPSNRKRKSESSLDDYQSTDGDIHESVSIQKTKRSKPNIRQYKNNIPIPKALNMGVYVECVACKKTRYLHDIFDPCKLPVNWTCEMGSNHTLSCDVVQENFDEPDDQFIYNNFTLGSVVWARARGFDWWPAITDNDPDYNQFYWTIGDTSDISHYHVSFLDEKVSRAWVTRKNIKAFRGKSDMDQMKLDKSSLKAIMKAANAAEECLKLSLQDCLNKYSFASRYTGEGNLWEKDKPRRKSRRFSESASSSDSIDYCYIPTSNYKPSSQQNIKNSIIADEFIDLSREISISSVKNETSIPLNQQTKHDLIVKNTLKSSSSLKKRKKLKN